MRQSRLGSACRPRQRFNGAAGRWRGEITHRRGASITGGFNYLSHRNDRDDGGVVRAPFSSPAAARTVRARHPGGAFLSDTRHRNQCRRPSLMKRACRVASLVLTALVKPDAMDNGI
jgi:hypothetical protein